MEQKLGIKFTKQFYGSATQQIEQLLPLYMSDAELVFVLDGEERVAVGPIEIQRTLTFFLHRSISVKAISTRSFEPYVIIQCSGVVDQEAAQPFAFHHCFVLKRMDPSKNLFCINRELLHVMKETVEKKIAPPTVVGPMYTGLPKAPMPAASVYQPIMQPKMGMPAAVPMRTHEVPAVAPVQPIVASSLLSAERCVLLVPSAGSPPINERGVSDAVSFVVRKMREKGALGAAPALGLTTFRLVSLVMSPGQAVVEVASPAIAFEMVGRGTLRVGNTICGIAPLNPTHPSFLQALQQLRPQQQHPVGHTPAPPAYPQQAQTKRGAHMTRPTTAPASVQQQPQAPQPTAPTAGQKGPKGKKGRAEAAPAPAAAAPTGPASKQTGLAPVEASFSMYVPSIAPTPGQPGFDSYTSGKAPAKDQKKAKPKKTAKAEAVKPQPEQKTPEKTPKQKEKKEKKEPTEGDKEKPKPKKEKPPRVKTVTTYSSPTTPASEPASPAEAVPAAEAPAAEEAPKTTEPAAAEEPAPVEAAPKEKEPEPEAPSTPPPALPTPPKESE